VLVNYLVSPWHVDDDFAEQRTIDVMMTMAADKRSINQDVEVHQSASHAEFYFLYQTNR
jgi:hypothetical protein